MLPFGCTCCDPKAILKNVDCRVQESSDGITIRVTGKTKEQTEALKSFFAAWKTLSGDSGNGGEGCC